MRAAPGDAIGEAHLRYRADIDGLRALAILPVLVFHAFPQAAPGGFVGVDVFFVISGYLISRIVLTGLHEGTFSFASFYAHRARRIFPSLSIILLATLAAGWFLLLPDEFAALGQHAAAGAGFVSNLLLWHQAGYFDAASDSKPLLHLWSLGIEEQFYIVWPLLLVVIAKFNRERKSLPAVVAGVSAISLLGSLIAVHRDATMAFYSPLPRAWELGVGALLACWHTSRFGKWREAPAAIADRHVSGLRLRDAASVAGFAMIIGAIVLVNEQRVFPGAWALLPVLGSASLIAAGPSAWLNRRVLSNAMLVGIGLISYQLYLWHWPLLVFARYVERGVPSATTRVFALIASFVLAWVTWRFIDLPVRASRRKPAMTIAACAALALIGIAGATVFVLRGVPNRVPKAARGLATFHYDYASAYREGTCFLRPEQNISDWHDCSDTAAHDVPRVWLWGDSHAAHLYPGIVALEKTHPMALTQITASMCPPLLDLDIETPPRPHCRAINDEAMRRIEADVPDIVILSAAWEAYDWHRVADTVGRLHRAGVGKIVVIGRVPEWSHALPGVFYEAYKSDPLHRLPKRMKSNLNPLIAGFDRELRRFVGTLPATYVSAYNILCNAEGCLTRVDAAADSIVAWDPSHLTSAGSKFLVAHFPASTFERAR